MLGAVEHVLGQKVHKGKLFRPRFLNRVHRADQTILEPGILLLNKSGKLRIGWRAPQRQDQPFDHGRNDRCQKPQTQRRNRPSGNACRIRKHEANQERNHRHTQDPRQTSKPEKLLPSGPYDSDFLQQLFMWCHYFLLRMSYMPDLLYKSLPYPPIKQSITNTTSPVDGARIHLLLRCLKNRAAGIAPACAEYWPANTREACSQD